MTKPIIRTMSAADKQAVAELICVSTNTWYQCHARPAIFASPEAAGVFFEVYEALDPGCGLLAIEPRTGALMGSCFYRVRATHLSLGIMNVHPNYHGRGVARALLGHITALADAAHKPVRLVSSAMNLDSYSLYTRAGFVPRQAYQDMLVEVPPEGIHAKVDTVHTVRVAREEDLPRLAELEMELCGIRREQDYALFQKNREGFWSLLVAQDERGVIDGFMASCAHPGCNMIGPGIARTQTVAAALLVRQLNAHKGRSPVFLVPVDAAELVSFAYALGAKNCELHFSQVRGAWTPFKGVSMPTFLPESA